MKKSLLSLSLLLFSTNVQAHFQVLYTPSLFLEKGQYIQLRQIFTHPFEDNYTLDMGNQHDTKELLKVEEFYSINKKKKLDLLNTLNIIDFKGNTNSGKAYASRYKAGKIGDHILVLKPAPFYDETQDVYIQQIVKTIINVAAAPTDWSDEVGLEVEIIPLVKPYAIWEGSNFTGIVKANSKIVPFANIDISYLNRDVNIKNNSMGRDRIKAPNKTFITLTIKANKNGEFNFTIPKAGFWGFSAQDLIKNKTFKNKELKQDALIWVEAKKMIEVK